MYGHLSKLRIMSGFQSQEKKLGLYKVLYTMHVTQHHAVFLQGTSQTANNVNGSIEDTFTADLTNY